MPKKLSMQAKIPIKEAEDIYNNYHTVLYKQISEMREKVLEIAKKENRVHLGLGCYLYTQNPDKEIRTLNNAICQFWSIITLLTINEMHKLIEKNNMGKNIEIVSSIYDSIYMHVDKDPKVIKWVNDTIIPILTKDFIKDIIVHNKAEGEIGLNWYDTYPISNNASVEEIEQILKNLE